MKLLESYHEVRRGFQPSWTNSLQVLKLPRHRAGCNVSRGGEDLVRSGAGEVGLGSVVEGMVFGAKKIGAGGVRLGERTLTE
jgi:hypothetical protein